MYCKDCIIIVIISFFFTLQEANHGTMSISYDVMYKDFGFGGR